jgi:hypothetical protein
VLLGDEPVTADDDRHRDAKERAESLLHILAPSASPLKILSLSKAPSSANPPHLL